MFTQITSSAVSVLMALILLTAGLAMPTSGQVPAGWYVVSSFQAQSLNQAPWQPMPGLGGLWLLHPRTPGNPIQVAGLPADLVGAPPAPDFSGANSVLILPDGRLAVGEVGSNTEIDLHLLTLTPGGGSVASATKFNLGSSGSLYGQVSQAAVLPNGRLLVAVSRLISGPLGSSAFSQLGIVDYLNDTVVPLPVSGLPSNFNYNALVVDDAGRDAFVGVMDSVNNLNLIYRVSLDTPTSASSSLLASAPAPGSNWVTNLALDNEGKLIMACGGTPGNLFSIDVTSGAVTSMLSPCTCLNGIALERETGGCVAVAPLTNGQSVAYDAMGGLLTSGPAGGWGAVSGVAVATSLESYGAPTPTAMGSLTWFIRPNPGGLPILGNPGFSATFASTDISAAGLWCLSTAPLSQLVSVQDPNGMLWQITLNVDLTQTLLWGSFAGPTQKSIPLPLPIIPSLSGVSVFMQCMTLSPAAGACASKGLSITII